MELPCPHCGILGIVEALAPGAVVEHVLCGACQKVSAVPLTRWERLCNEFDDKDQNPYMLLPLEQLPKPEPIPEPEPAPYWSEPGWFHDHDLRMKALQKTSTRELLNMLARDRIGTLDENSWEGWVTTEELKAVLATRPHVPNKREGRKIRQQKAKQRHERRRRR